jgi:acyl-CoA thioester hydrolase
MSSTAPAPALPFRTEIEVCFRDLDGLGHVNNSVYLTYLEITRTRYWWAITGDRSRRDFSFILGKAECTYKSPAVLGEIIVIESGITRIGNASFTWEYRLSDKDSGRLIALAATEQVWYDYQNKRATRIPEEWRARLASFEAQLAADKADASAATRSSHPPLR